MPRVADSVAANPLATLADAASPTLASVRDASAVIPAASVAFADPVTDASWELLCATGPLLIAATADAVSPSSVRDVDPAGALTTDAAETTLALARLDAAVATCVVSALEVELTGPIPRTTLPVGPLATVTFAEDVRPPSDPFSDPAIPAETVADAEPVIAPSV